MGSPESQEQGAGWVATAQALVSLFFPKRLGARPWGWAPAWAFSSIIAPQCSL